MPTHCKIIHPMRKRALSSFFLQKYAYGAFLLVSKCVFTAVYVLLMGFPAHGQFLNITVEVPASIQADNNSFPEESLITTDPKTDVQTLTNTRIFTITAVENIHILASMMHHTMLPDAAQHTPTPAIVLWAKQNDGSFLFTRGNMDTQTPLSFPINNSRRIIRHIEGAPARLNAYLFVTTIKETTNNNATFLNHLTIEII